MTRNYVEMATNKWVNKLLVNNIISNNVDFYGAGTFFIPLTTIQTEVSHVDKDSLFLSGALVNPIRKFRMA